MAETNNGAKEIDGIIVLLDALGVRDLSLEQSHHYILVVERAIHFFKNKKDRKYDITVRSFGDSVLFAWDFEVDDKNGLLQEIISSVRIFLALCYDRNIIFRGAISIGKYIESETAILGPALTDAAMWYDQADWFGCICTPKTTYQINSLMLNNITTQLIFLHLYNVPLKDKSTLRTWAINFGSIVGSGDKSTDVNELANYMFETSNKTIPIGTEHKYLNSINFFTATLSRKLPHCSKEAVLQEYSIDIAASVDKNIS